MIVFRAQFNRSQIEATVNRKTMVLAVLLLCGCFMWVPILARWMARQHAVAAVIPPSSSSMTPILSASTSPAISVATDQDGLWDGLAESLSQDPPKSPGTVETLTRSPARPCEIPTRPAATATMALSDEFTTADASLKPNQFELGSTTIGHTRRAAMINGRLYYHGNQIQADGRNYLIGQIESHRVVLSSGDESLELTLARPQQNGTVTHDSGFDADSQ